MSILLTDLEEKRPIKMMRNLNNKMKNRNKKVKSKSLRYH